MSVAMGPFARADLRGKSPLRGLFDYLAKGRALLEYN